MTPASFDNKLELGKGNDCYQVSDRLVRYLRDELGFRINQANLEETVARVNRSIEGFNSFEEFASTISSLISVHETYFLRHHEQFKWLEEAWAIEVLETWGNKTKPVRILSAGCATGEEPYSLFAHLNPIFESRGLKLEIDAVDISAEVISFAQKGKYGLWSMRGVVLENESNWLNMHSRHICVQDWVKKGVKFHQRNITKPSFLNRHNHYDLILCRNVMIYMHEQAVQKVLENLGELLSDKGYILPGPSDPNPQESVPLKIEWMNGVRLFVKKNKNLSEVITQDITNELPFINLDVDNNTIPKVFSVNLDDESEKKITGTNFSSYAEVESLIKSCHYDGARNLLEENIKNNPLDTRSYVMLAMLAMELDDIDLADYATKKASFLCSSEPYPVYLLANYKQKLKDKNGEKKCLVWVKEALAAIDPEEPVKFCEDVRGCELLVVVEHRLQAIQ